MIKEVNTTVQVQNKQTLELIIYLFFDLYYVNLYQPCYTNSSFFHLNRTFDFQKRRRRKTRTACSMSSSEFTYNNSKIINYGKLFSQVGDYIFFLISTASNTVLIFIRRYSFFSDFWLDFCFGGWFFAWKDLQKCWKNSPRKIYKLSKTQYFQHIRKL